MSRYIWEPGNSTRYDLFYHAPPRAEDKCLLVWLHKGGSGGTAIMFDGFLHHTYIEEKMGINSTDAAALLLFLEHMGHSVGMPAVLNVGDWRRTSRLSRGRENA